MSDIRLDDILMWCLPNEQAVVEDENLVYDGNLLYLKDNPEAKIRLPYGFDTPQDVYDEGEDVLELYRYFFREYGIFFYSYSYVNEYTNGLGYGMERNAAEWIGITSFMMDLGGWTEEDAIKIIKQREEWLPLYEFYEDLKYRNFLSFFYDEVRKVDMEYEYTGSAAIPKWLYEDIETFIEEDMPMLITEDVALPESLISSINNMCSNIKKGMEKGVITIEVPTPPEEKITEEKDEDLPF